jgi:hypothetical protein
MAKKANKYLRCCKNCRVMYYTKSQLSDVCFNCTKSNSKFGLKQYFFTAEEIKNDFFKHIKREYYNHQSK